MKDHYSILLSQDLCRLVNVSASLALVRIVCTEIIHNTLPPFNIVREDQING